MSQPDLAALIDQYYPKAKTCAHAQHKISLEKESADDRYYYIVVTRCVECNWPSDDRYATREEIETLSKLQGEPTHAGQRN